MRPVENLLDMCLKADSCFCQVAHIVKVTKLLNLECTYARNICRECKKNCQLFLALSDDVAHTH
jgi:hypothetical protein